MLGVYNTAVVQGGDHEVQRGFSASSFTDAGW